MVMAIDLLKDIRYELHENNEQFILKENRYRLGGVQHALPDKRQRKLVHPQSTIKHNIILDADATKAILEIKQLKEELSKSAEHKSNLSKVCIEFDNIDDVPKVFVDGRDVADMERNNSGLQVLHIDWVTNDECKRPKKFYLRYVDERGEHAIIDRGDGEGGVKIYG